MGRNGERTQPPAAVGSCAAWMNASDRAVWICDAVAGLKDRESWQTDKRYLNASWGHYRSGGNLLRRFSGLDVVNFVRNSTRYKLAAYSTFANVVSKGLALFVLYASVPRTIDYLGPERFGIWMTLASLIGVLGFLDFGISNGLLNQVAYLAARDTRDRLRRLIGHALLLLTGIGLFLIVLLSCTARYAHLEFLFNITGPANIDELRSAAMTLAVLIGLSLPLVGLQRVFWGLQRAFISHLFSAVGSAASVILLFVLSDRHAPIYMLLLGTYGIQLLTALPLLAVLLKDRLIGKIDWVEFRGDARDLLRTGGLFFVLNVGAAVSWDGDYLIISRVAGPQHVAVFAIAARLFQLVSQPLAMVNSPLWSAYADAIARGSHRFVRKTLIGAVSLTGVGAMIGVSILVLFHTFIVREWVHNAVSMPTELLICMAAWTVLQAVGNAFGMFLNGARIVRPQVVVVCLYCLVGLPLKIFGADQAGALGVVTASMIGYVLCVVLPYLTIFRRAWTSRLLGE